MCWFVQIHNKHVHNYSATNKLLQLPWFQGNHAHMYHMCQNVPSCLKVEEVQTSQCTLRQWTLNIARHPSYLKVEVRSNLTMHTATVNTKHSKEPKVEVRSNLTMHTATVNRPIACRARGCKWLLCRCCNNTVVVVNTTTTCKFGIMHLPFGVPLAQRCLLVQYTWNVTAFCWVCNSLFLYSWHFACYTM